MRNVPDVQEAVLVAGVWGGRWMGGRMSIYVSVSWEAGLTASVGTRAEKKNGYSPIFGLVAISMVGFGDFCEHNMSVTAVYPTRGTIV